MIIDILGVNSRIGYTVSVYESQCDIKQEMWFTFL